MFSVGVVFWEIIYRILEGKHILPYSDKNLANEFQIMNQVAKGLRPTIPKTCPESVLKMIDLLWHAEYEKKKDLIANKLWNL